MTTEITRYGKTHGLMPNRIPFVLVCAECGSAVKDVGAGRSATIAIECTKYKKHSGLMKPEKWAQLHPQPKPDETAIHAVLQHPAIKPLRKRAMEALYGKPDPD